MLKPSFAILLAFCIMMGCKTKEEAMTPNTGAIAPIVPKPVSVTVGNEKIELKNVSVSGDTEEAKQIASLFSEFLKGKKISTAESNGSVMINFAASQDSTLGKEGYRITTTANQILVESNTGAGHFYGMQSLMQLVGAWGSNFQRVEITDYPRFSYRGLHLDVCRHIFPIEFVKKYIDLLSRHKMNRFHWHLTDDQGWRIEIKKYPKLHEVGAHRKETVIGHASTATRGDRSRFDGTPYGGYYTQEQIREVVQYAAERYVTVVPEIEMPGHALAALSAYPHLGCTGGPYEAATTWGVFDDVFCAGKEETFKFLEDVLDEVLELFPGEYVHIGGDECPKTRWKTCPHCQKRIKNEKLKDEHELQSYFIQRMEKYLNGKGRQIIGWDEILEGGLAPNATVMSWRGEEGGIAAAQQNHDVVMTPGNWCYFDNYQDTTGTEPLAIGGFTPVSEVYEYEPQPKQLTAEQAKHILGAQANLWTEYIETSDHAEYMVYPRASALSEVLWTPASSRDYDDFLKRLKFHLNRLDEWDVNYAKHVLKEVEKVGNSESK